MKRMLPAAVFVFANAILGVIFAAGLVHAQAPPVPVNNGGTGANLSATGGTSEVLLQTSTGAAVSVRQLACADLSNAGASCSASAAANKGCIDVWDSNTIVVAVTVTCDVPSFAGTIGSVRYYTNGTSTPSFTAAININGTPVTGCSAISISSSTVASATCTAANTFNAGDKIEVVVSSVSGVPSQAAVRVNYQ